MKHLLLIPCIILLSCNKSNVEKGDSCSLKGDTKNAIHYYELAIRDGNVEAMNKLAFLYSNQFEHEKAEKYYLMAIEHGDVVSARTLAARSLSENDFKGVIKYSKKLADEGNIELSYDLGVAYLNLQEYDLAIRYLKMDENSVYNKDHLGEAYYKKGDFESAEKYWKSAIDEHHSGAINSHTKLLKLYLELDRKKDYEEYKDKYDNINF